MSTATAQQIFDITSNLPKQKMLNDADNQDQYFSTPHIMCAERWKRTKSRHTRECDDDKKNNI